MNIFTIVILTLLLSSCSLFKAQKGVETPVSATAITVKEGWKNFIAETYSIQYPADWELNNSGLLGTSCMLLSPLSNSTDEIRENVNIITQDNSNFNLSLDTFVEMSQSQLDKIITGLKIISNERKEKDGETYHEITYSGLQGKYRLMFKQHYFVNPQMIYVLTFTSAEDAFADYEALGDEILNSFVKQ